MPLVDGGGAHVLVEARDFGRDIASQREMGRHIVPSVVAGAEDPVELAERQRHGILRLDKKTGKITIECWPLLVDPSDAATGGQFPGWPKTISVEDNYGRAAWGYLPEIQVSGLENPVVQVVDVQLSLSGNLFTA